MKVDYKKTPAEDYAHAVVTYKDSKTGFLFLPPFLSFFFFYSLFIYTCSPIFKKKIQTINNVNRKNSSNRSNDELEFCWRGSSSLLRTSWSRVLTQVPLPPSLSLLITFYPFYSLFLLRTNTLNTSAELFLSRNVKGQQGEDIVEKQNAESGVMPIVPDEAHAYGYCWENRYLHLFLPPTLLSSSHAPLSPLWLGIYILLFLLLLVFFYFCHQLYINSRFHLSFCRHFVQSFLNGKEPLLTYEDGVQVTKLLMACCILFNILC